MKSPNNTTQPTYMITLSIKWLSPAWPAVNLNKVPGFGFSAEDLCKHDGPRPAFAPKPKLSCEQKTTMNICRCRIAYSTFESKTVTSKPLVKTREAVAGCVQL